MALVTSVVSITVPFALGSTVAMAAWYQYAPPGVALLPFALFMGSAMSMTAFPVLVRILADQGLRGRASACWPSPARRSTTPPDG